MILALPFLAPNSRRYVPPSPALLVPLGLCFLFVFNCWRLVSLLLLLTTALPGGPCLQGTAPHPQPPGQGRGCRSLRCRTLPEASRFPLPSSAPSRGQMGRRPPLAQVPVCPQTHPQRVVVSGTVRDGAGIVAFQGIREGPSLRACSWLGAGSPWEAVCRALRRAGARGCAGAGHRRCPGSACGSTEPSRAARPLALASPRAVLGLGAAWCLLQSPGVLSPGEAVTCKEGSGGAGVPWGGGWRASGLGPWGGLGSR